MRAQFPDQEDPLEEGMAAHSSILAWRIPGTEEPGGLQSMGSQRVRHDCSDLASLQAQYCYYIVITIIINSIHNLCFSVLMNSLRSLQSPLNHLKESKKNS